jgi:hypothetical protein
MYDIGLAADSRQHEQEQFKTIQKQTWSDQGQKHPHPPATHHPPPTMPPSPGRGEGELLREAHALRPVYKQLSNWLSQVALHLHLRLASDLLAWPWWLMTDGHMAALASRL